MDVSLSLAAPWALAALVALPALWWLLRVTPPTPRRMVFPAVRLLRGLRAEERVSARTPWWLLMLRLLIVVLVVGGMARPLIDPAPAPDGSGALLLVIDDGWAAAADWEARRTAASAVLAQAVRRDQPVILLLTARPLPGPPPRPLEPRPAAEVQAVVQALGPRPWGTDRRAALTRLQALSDTPVAQVVWLHDGLEDAPVSPSATQNPKSPSATQNPKSPSATQNPEPSSATQDPKPSSATQDPESGAAALAAGLAERGTLTVLRGTMTGASPLVLIPPRRGGAESPPEREATPGGTPGETPGATPETPPPGSLAVTVRRPGGGSAPATTVWVRLLDGEGRVLARTPVSFAAGAPAAQGWITPPLAAQTRSDAGDGAGDGAGETPRSAQALLDLTLDGSEPVASVAGRVLLDEALSPRTIGLATPEGTGDGGAGVPLLAPLYFVARALAPHGEIREAPLASLLARPPAVIVLPDLGRLTDPAARALDAWVRRGGTLIRFAGPRPASDQDPLLPVRLRAGDRTMGGAMSWRKPAHLATFSETGPFAGLAVPPAPAGEVSVSSQVLAEPDPGLEGKTWARLDDGTPLVTGERREAGHLVLFHVTPDPSWSSLPLSVLFEDMLTRLVRLTPGGLAPETGPTRLLAPWRVMDAFGRLGPPGQDDRPLGPDDRAADGSARVGPGVPPGLYGDETQARAVNLGSGVSLETVGTWPSGTVLRPLEGGDHERDLMAPLLVLGLALALLDLVLSLILRGLIVLPRRPRFRVVSPPRAAGAVLLGALGLGLALGGAGVEAAHARGELENGLERDTAAALQPRLAYVLTGDGSVDRVSGAALKALTDVVGRRTAADLGPPVGVDLSQDDPLLYPVLYWPVTEGQGALSAAGAQRVNRYLRSGGLLVLDTRDGARLASVVGGVDLPPLRPVDQGHVLTRSFYLLDTLPGRVPSPRVWISTGGDNDGVASVIVGDADWAGAWAHEDGRGYLFAVAPGGAQQREWAYRFGVNLVIYALTGNYKGDQVHMNAILERLGR